ncbi:MAG: hypothetical protein P1V97_00670 [Planctomycetota bacterium]|nr:hypothetical protein [Planctomycetota bacterium]
MSESEGQGKASRAPLKTLFVFTPVFLAALIVLYLELDSTERAAAFARRKILGTGAFLVLAAFGLSFKFLKRF